MQSIYKIAVTGAGGHVGNVLCRMLADSIRDFYDWHFSNNKNDLKWI